MPNAHAYDSIRFNSGWRGMALYAVLEENQLLGSLDASRKGR